MIVIQKVQTGKCRQCDNNATIKINGMAFCTQCSDTLLITTAGRCIEAVQFASVSLSLIPKVKHVRSKKSLRKP